MQSDLERTVEPGQSFSIDRFRREDAPGIAALFSAEYGSSYPIETYYIPERIIAENESGNIHSVVARTPTGAIIGHGALYRSSPQYPDLYEIGQYIVLPEYRTTFAAYKINRFIAETLTALTGPSGIFGEAVTHITATQKSSAQIGMKDVALEMELMPAEAYEKSQSASGRISCLIQFRSFRDRPQEIFVPLRYREVVEYILADVEIERTVTPSAQTIPKGAETRLTARFFGHAGVGRFNIVGLGGDFERIVTSLEREGRENKTLVFQFFLNLGEPWAGEAVAVLRGRGYSFGGCVPRWFDADGLLMQKILAPPDFDAPRLHSAKARQLRDFVRSDWQNPAPAPGL
ncbi:MAG: GNAT family N-acetyltransferase [Syntrophales bacterium]